MIYLALLPRRLARDCSDPWGNSAPFMPSSQLEGSLRGRNEQGKFSAKRSIGFLGIPTIWKVPRTVFGKRWPDGGSSHGTGDGVGCYSQFHGLRGKLFTAILLGGLGCCFTSISGVLPRRYGEYSFALIFVFGCRDWSCLRWCSPSHATATGLPWENVGFPKWSKMHR